MNAPHPKLVCIESVGDLPVLWAFFHKLDLFSILDRRYPTPLHWKGSVTPSEVLAVWLLFVLSQSDHCLSHVEPWVAQHQAVLSALLGKTIRPTDLQDDRLADWLTRLGSEDGVWGDLEQELNQQTIRVYQLPTDLVRIDTTTANSYADVVSEQGLLQFGHSKDDADRPQIKIAAAVLDPLGMPLVTTVVPGNTADDPLYVPTIQAVQESIGAGRRTYVGDCKMAALATRAFVASTGDFYLCPLSEVQLSQTARHELLQPLWDGAQALQFVYRPGSQGEPDELVAEGFSVDVACQAKVEKKETFWTERRWLVRSAAFAQAQEVALDRRLSKAETALRELATRKQGKKRLTKAEMTRAAETIVSREGVKEMLRCEIRSIRKTRQKRAYGDKPATRETTTTYTIELQRNEAAIQEQKRRLGWQVYAVNHLEMSLTQVVRAYRGQYRIENDWSRLKNQPLGLTPIYLQDEGRIQGLVHLLSLALRVLTLVEWSVREELAKTGKKVRGVYPGQAGRKTDRPSAELLLAAMKTISLSVIEIQGQSHVLMSPLSETQKQLLELWGLPENLYSKLVEEIPKPPPNTSEP